MPLVEPSATYTLTAGYSYGTLTAGYSYGSSSKADLSLTLHAKLPGTAVAVVSDGYSGVSDMCALVNELCRLKACDNTRSALNGRPENTHYDDALRRPENTH